jgi:hypothetical protein
MPHVALRFFVLAGLLAQGNAMAQAPPSTAHSTAPSPAALACYDLHVGMLRGWEAQLRACRSPLPPPVATALQSHIDGLEQRFEFLFGGLALAEARRRLDQLLQGAVRDDPEACRSIGHIADQAVQERAVEIERMRAGLQTFAFRPIPNAMACE